MSVLLYDPVKKNHILLLRNGLWEGKRWSVDLHVCDNPCCGCCNIDFKCTPADEDLNSQVTSANFILDAEKHSIYRAAGRRGSKPSDSLAAAVVKELEEEDWKYLYEFLLRAKQNQIENCDPRLVDAHFPPEVLRGDGTVVGYGEIFPLAAAMPFSIGSEQWLAMDDYCVNPECDCQDVVLQFVKSEKKASLPRTTKKPPPAIFYDYGKKKFKPAQIPGESLPSLQTLFSGLKDQRQGLDGELKKRHQRLKELFKSALRKNAIGTDQDQTFLDSMYEPFTRNESALLRASKPGRNDPCPCGSGKKFKKCCGT